MNGKQIFLEIMRLLESQNKINLGKAFILTYISNIYIK